jgi:hypothetical protein
MSRIPTELPEKQFAEHIEPYLSKAARGYSSRIPLYRVFNYILYWLHTGCQWEQLAIAAKPGSEKKKSVLELCITIFSSGVMTAVSKPSGNTAF